MSQSHKCQNLTLVLSVLQETSCCSTDNVQSGDISSLLRNWDGQRTLWSRAGTPQKHFQFYFPFNKRIYFTVTLWISLIFLLILLIHTGTITPVTVIPSDWWMCLTCRENDAHLEATTNIQEYCQDFFYLVLLAWTVSLVSQFGECPAHQLTATMLGSGQGKASAWVMYFSISDFVFREESTWD